MKLKEAPPPVNYGKETSGRCRRCNVRYLWPGKPRLKDAYCPNCGYKLSATTHMFKAGPTVNRKPITKENKN